MKLNEPLAQFPLSLNMTTILGIMFVQHLESEMLVLPFVNQPSNAAPSLEDASLEEMAANIFDSMFAKDVKKLLGTA